MGNTHKHVLLATIGVSPQVVTETLYAIHQENGLWPDEVFLITTSVGKGNILQLNFEQHLKRLCSELQRPVPAFAESHILVTPGADGTAVEDARSLADHEALANFIMTTVRDHTANPGTSLHASLAGGRKTMTFYIGYAMSLFGRQQDTLSHVLVSDGYEGNPGFWFPTRADAHRYTSDKNGNSLDASAAEVTLAPIPFIRHRHNLPQVLLQKQSNATVNFGELVQLINLGENPQALCVEIDLSAKAIRLKNSASALVLEFQSGLLELAFYTMMARVTTAQETDLTRPANTGDIGLARLLLEELMPLCGLPDASSLSDNLAALENWNALHQQLKNRTLEALKNGMPPTWFDSRITHLRKTFEEKTPASLARWLVPSSIWTVDGIRLPQSDAERTIRGGGYGINLQPEQIHIIEADAK